MARTGKVAVSITADPSGLEHGLRRAESDVDRFGNKGTKSFHGLKTAALAAGAAITTGVVIGLKQSVDAAIEAEKSQAKLEAQLKALGISYKAHAAEIDNVIQKTSQLSGLDDEDLQDAFTGLVRASGSVNKSLKEMALVADIARARHMDVGKAGELVAKVMNGNTSILKRYGISLKDGATATEALGELQRRFGGQAEAYGKTTAGAQDRFRVATENLKEAIGNHLLPVLTSVATKAANFVGQMESGKGAGGAFVRTLKSIYDTVKPVVQGFIGVARAVLQSKTAMIGLGIALSALAIAKTASKVKDLASNFAGLGKAGKFGGLISALSLVAGGLAIMVTHHKSATQAAEDLADALDDERNALKRVRDLDLDAAQAKAQAKASALAVKQAEDQLTATRKQYGKNSTQAKQAEVELTQAKIQAKRDTRALKDIEGDANSTRREYIKTTQKSAQAQVDAAFSTKGWTGSIKELRTQMGLLRSKKVSVDVDVSRAITNIRSVNGQVDEMIRKLQQAGVLRSQTTGGGGGGSLDDLVHEGPGIQRKGAVASANRMLNPTQNLAAVTNTLDRLDLKATAGRKTPDQADAIKLSVIATALRDPRRPLSGRGRLELQATANQIRQGQVQRKADRVTPAYTLYVQKRDFIDSRANAGEIGPNAANAQRIALCDQALKNTGPFAKFKQKKNQLSPNEQRLVKADRKAASEDLKAAAAAAIEDATTFKGTDFDDAALTAAQVDTPNDVTDDKAVLTGRLGIAKAKYDAAKAAGDRGGIATWGGLMLSLQQSIDSLDDSLQKNTEALLDLQKQQTENYQRLYNTSESNYATLAKAIMDVANGGIGGMMGLGFQTPGFAGSAGMARY